jgi:hypothetical protein
MTSEELADAGLPPVEEDMQGTEIGQLSEEMQLLMDLRTVRREKLDLRERILKMWMPI